MRRFSLLMTLLLATCLAWAQDNIRYVSTTGAYINDGKSWANAKNKIQDAINDLGAGGGYVFVAAGTYTPSESTEKTGGSTLYMSFKIPEGVKVYGGFAGNEIGATAEEIIGKRVATKTELGSFFWTNKSILSGNLSADAVFTWNAVKKQYETTFYGNCYHVVWFANNGFEDVTIDGEKVQRAKPLEKEAVLDGFTIQGGHAHNTSVTTRAHNAYGGGAYMVKGSTVSHCEFVNCDASRDGGAIYMDGGGTVDWSFVHNCQALGLGVLSGYGGAICMDGGEGKVLHTAMLNNVGRMGGALAIHYQSTMSDNKLGLMVAASVMANNVATTEGGGAYLNEGGLLDNCTVVRNECNGTGVTSNGMTTGRAAGVYVRDHGRIYNSVLWGGSCKANNNVQYANSRSSVTDAKLKPELHYVAMNQADRVDWSGSVKDNVFKLSDYNSEDDVTAAGATPTASEGYPLFDDPAPKAGHGTEVSNPDTWHWETSSLSAINHRGISIRDLNVPGVTVSGTPVSIKNEPYIAHCTLGAYISAKPEIVALNPETDEPKIFVDPQKVVSSATSVGASWTTPVTFLADALEAARTTYAGKQVTIYVKEGTVENISSTFTGRVRDMVYDIPNGTILRGGYSSELTGTNVSDAERNPVQNPTILSAKITKDYNFNAAHLIRFGSSVTDATLDGFQLRYANATGKEISVTSGAAITLDGSTDVKINNVLVAGCTADNGAAVYAINGGQATFENCIFHNNTVGVADTKAVIYTDGTSQITFDHGDVLRNIGHGFVNANTTASNITNSVFYANMNAQLDDTNGNGDKALSALIGAFTGNNNLFDVASTTPIHTSIGQNILTFEFVETSGASTYPRMINPTKNSGVSTGGDVTYYGRAASFQPYNTNPMVNAAAAVGAHTNWGKDMTNTITRDYGGLPDIGALENHRATIDQEGDNAYADGQPKYGSVLYVRDYGSDTSIINRDGSSWARAINGNATYNESGKNVNGLQHAVNTAENLIKGDGWNTQVVTVQNYKTSGTNSIDLTYNHVREGNELVQVWVGAGTYTNSAGVRGTGLNASRKETADAAFEARNHVKVYGAFPKVGNPGMNERHPQLTQGVTVSADNAGINIEDYETILQPATSLANNTKNLRVLKHPDECIPIDFANNTGSCNTPRNHVVYEDVLWDGFTIRYGKITTEGGRSGGAGVRLLENFTLTNCVVKENQIASGSSGGRGNAIFCEGGIINNCYVMNNVTDMGNELFGGGIYAISGEIFNTVVAGNGFTNASNKSGSGIFIEDAKFYNNTIVNNKGGVPVSMYPASAGKANLDIYNTIIIATDGDFIRSHDGGLRAKIINCYVKSSQGVPTWVTNTNSQVSNTLADPFAKAIATANSTYDYRLATNSGCINQGTEDIGEAILPGFDMDYADRIQDCRVDIGAYEFNGAYSITPDVTTVSGQAIYYVTPEGYGTSSASDPENAACAAKLQKVIDAAGRYKYDNPGKQVIVKVANSYEMHKGNPYAKTVDQINGKKFIVTNLDMNRTLLAHHTSHPAGEQDMFAGDISSGSISGGYYYVRFLKVDDGSDNHYTMQLMNENDELYRVWGNQGYVNFQPEAGNIVFCLGLGGQYGQDGTNLGLWEVTKDPGSKGFIIKNVGRNAYYNPSEAKPSATPVACMLMETLGRKVTDFTYYATRTTDEDNQNVRVWSIIIPRGVEVWGGYTDVALNDDGTEYKVDDKLVWNNTYNGFTFNGNDRRDITGHPTYFDSYYYNKEQKSGAITYHVVTFADKKFDGDGKEIAGQKMSDKTTDRAVIDGIFITGGMANGESAGSTVDDVNINQYGGAAIVTDYAHVRNCIVTGNQATYGGALALTHGALVSGSLFLENEADYGGALYVFEDGTTLSDGTEVQSTSTGGSIDENMAHVYTSTIVRNNANVQGGGLWFDMNNDANVRINSSVLWMNDSPDLANVAGAIAPNGDQSATSVSTQMFYPFSYSAVQNQRMPGTNNIQISTNNNNGGRFGREDANDPTVYDYKTIAKTDPEYVYYGLTNYSSLVQNGMPCEDYDNLVASMGLSPIDFMKMDRKISNSGKRTYVEIGARALDKPLQFDKNNLMLRLYVSAPEHTDMEAAQKMMDLAAKVSPTPDEEMYMQEGSSFAYPFQKLDQALEYIYTARKLAMDENIPNPLYGITNNIPFEIFIGKGEYHPSRDIAGNYGYSLGNTFLIPEGVSLYGGFNAQQGVTDSGKSFLGQYNKIKTTDGNYDISTDPDATGYYFIAKNVEGRDAEDVNIDGINIKQIEYKKAISIENRPKADINANNIIEPWEFENETVLSGAATNVANEGVYHVITILADQNLVGALPVASVTHEDKASHPTATWYDYSSVEYGAYDYEEGQTVTLNGLKVTGGRAVKYHEGTFKEGDLGIYSYYHGGGLQVDGNRYSDYFNKLNARKTSITGPKDVNSVEHSLSFSNETAQYLHTGISNAVGFRDIPVSIENCKFTDNWAGYGGAINSNGTIDIFNSSLEQNKAVNGSDKVMFDMDSNGSQDECTVSYPGNGGAAYGTHQLSMFNTLLANNEAVHESYEMDPHQFPTLRNQAGGDEIYGGAGGAVYAGRFSCFHFVNCDFVRNLANMYPAVFTMNPNRDYQTVSALLMTPYYSQFTNTLFWGNQVNKKMNKWMTDSKFSKFAFNSKLICNFGRAQRTRGEYYKCDWETSSDIPAGQSELDDMNKFSETAWFCAYEDGQGITPKNLKDYRDLDYSPFGYAVNQIIAAGGEYQNCNIMLAADNDDLNGPNFVSPSNTAGVAGYTESADWSPARLNNLTDQGSGKIMQTINIVGDEYSCNFDKYSTNDQVTALYPARQYYSLEESGDYITAGAYTMTRYLAGYPKYNENLVLGEDYYMKSATTQQMLYRVSYDPNPTHNQTFIDIGVYEYPHTELKFTTEADEVDILWVSSREKPDNGLPEGSDWTRPTSDLQRAIETLLASRNGHRKEIRLMDGHYTPIYTIEGNLSFYFNTEYVNQSVMMPEGWRDMNIADLSVKSFTIKGGYSKDQKNVFDTYQYPAIIKGQNRTDATGDQWNYAFYIKDAIQRYGNSVTDANGQGAFAIYGQGDTPKPYVIPIEISGVTVINDQALSNTDGAAIRYEDQALEYTGNRFATGTYVPESPSQAHVRVAKYYTDKTFTTPAPDGVITEFVKYGGTRKYYTDRTYKTETSEETLFWKEVDGYVSRPQDETDPSVPAKFILSNSTILGSGTHYDGAHQNDKSSSAVYVGTGGGYALFYNDVMHSNYGNPLVSMCTTEIVNNTFALNAGLVDLGGEITLDQSGSADATGPMLAPQRRLPAAQLPTLDSKIFNSIFWRNNPLSSGNVYGPQFSLPGYKSDSDVSSKNKFMRNAYTYNSGTGSDLTPYTDYVSANSDLEQQYFNVHISNENRDLIHGPNFTDPENGDIMARDFTLQPSLRMLNKGDKLLYRDLLTHDYGDTHPLGFTLDSYNVYSYAWETQTQYDAAHRMRVLFTNIDLGAYEYQQPLNRVIYVDPNATYSPGQEGQSWEDALGGSSIQLATDLAALYHVNNPTQRAYVFVRGNNTTTNIDKDTEEKIVLRDGVSLIGSLDPNDVTSAYMYDKSQRLYKEADLDNYVKYVYDKRVGIAAPNANKTIIHGISTNPNTRYDYQNSTYALADGFVVMAGDATQPVIDVNPQPATDEKAVMALRNILVTGNHVTGPGVNVANVGNALLYEVLMQDNTSEGGVVLNLTDGGYLVNGTIEGQTWETNGYGTASPSHVAPTSDGSNARTFNSLVNYGGIDWIEKTFSGANYPINYTSGYRKPEADTNLNYQLAEGSKNIDACATVNPLTGIAPNLAPFINYATDRDLLGNPRLLAIGTEAVKTLDRGAFETWKVNKAVVETTGSDASYVENDGLKQADFTAAVHNYPHFGSVVYIFEGNSLVSGYDMMPGYLLVQKGGNLFGQGHKVDASYLTVEREVKADGSLISMPFVMDYNKDVTMVTSDDATGVITLTKDEPNVFRYNGLMRSGWTYDIMDSDSPCWDALRTGEKAGTGEGVLYTPKAENGNQVYRFTGNSGSFTDFIYTENGESKDVILTQYNSGGRTSTVPGGSPEGVNGNTADNADFTSKEDMGWNAVGLPYLVTDYRPYEMAQTAIHGAGSAGKYMMHIPHELWIYYDGMIDINDNTRKTGAGFYAVNSWESTAADWNMKAGETPSIWVGEGFFTQTATLDETETLTFFRPVYTPASPIKTERWYFTDKLEEVITEGLEIVETRYYTPDGIQQDKPRKGVTIAVDIYSDGTQRSRKYLNKK